MIIIAVSLVLMAPALIDAGSVRGDFYIYARWQAHFAQAFGAGDLYPRWLPELNHGFGSPAFFIYPPLSQWLALLLTPLLPGAEAAGLRLILVLTISLAVGGFGAYFWLRQLVSSRAAALVGTLAWLLLPYHAYFNLYQRGAFAELVAMAVLPWGLAFAHLIQRRKSFAWAGLALSLTALLTSNAPTALFGAPFICLYAMLLAAKGQRWRIALTILLSALLALALSAAWLWPALSQIGLVDDGILFDNVYQPANYLVFSPTPWPNQGVRIAVTLIFLLHSAILMLALAIGGRARGRTLMIISVFAILLAMSEASRPFWGATLPWSKIQFAWRLLGLQSLLLAGLIALAWQMAASRRSGTTRSALLCLLPALLLVDAALLAGLAWHASRRPAWPTPPMAAYRAEVREYWLGDVDSLARRFGQRDAIVLSGRAQTGSIDRQGRILTLDVRADGPALIVLRHFAYSGWIVRIDGGRPYPALRPADLPELSAVAVPPGQHRITLQLPPLPAESRGLSISAAALLLFLGTVLLDLARRLVARRNGTPI